MLILEEKAYRIMEMAFREHAGRKQDAFAYDACSFFEGKLINLHSE
jgi:hypothetical protein